MGALRLTQRQQEVLTFIEHQIAAKGYPPTTRELATACGLGTPSAAHRMLGVLERKGYLARTPGTKRAITISPPVVDVEHLTSELLDLLATAVGWQDVAVERCLEAAQSTRDPGTRTALIKDAAERHESTTSICEAVAPADLRNRSTPAVDELRWYRERVPWPYFVVDHLVYNTLLVAGTEPLEIAIQPLTRPLEAFRRRAEESIRQSAEWLEALLPGLPDGELERLRNRAAFLEQMMVRTADHFGYEPFSAAELPGILCPTDSGN
jgi:hypothetical protein